MSEPYKVLSLFAGIGGFDLGLQRTGGFKTTEVAELDGYASKVLAKRFPDAPNAGDVTKAEYRDADIICAGFPCQDISFAGEGAGLAGVRSGLWREVVRAVRMVGPRYTLLENVAALLSRGMGTVLGDLAEVGHDAEWHCIPASAVGAPHRRDRIWIVAYPGSEQHEGCSPKISGALAEELSRASADAATVFGTEEQWSEPHGDHAGAGTLADASCELFDRSGERPEQAGRDEPANCGEDVADSRGIGRKGCRDAGEGERTRFSPAWQEASGSSGSGDAAGSWWSFEPNVGRVAHGVPSRVDRLRCLGNAVVPQIPELIGRAILAAEAA